MSLRTTIIILLGLIMSSFSEAKVDLDCEAQYRQWTGGDWPAYLGEPPVDDSRYWSAWSKSYRLEVSFLAGLEFTAEYRSAKSLEDYNMYAAIWFSQENVAVVDVGSGVLAVRHEMTDYGINSGVVRMSLANWFTYQPGYNTAQGLQVNRSGGERVGWKIKCAPFF